MPTEAAALSTAEDQNQTILHLELDEPRNKGSRLLQDLDGWQMMPLGVPKACHSSRMIWVMEGSLKQRIGELRKQP